MGNYNEKGELRLKTESKSHRFYEIFYQKRGRKISAEKNGWE